MILNLYIFNRLAPFEFANSYKTEKSACTIPYWIFPPFFPVGLNIFPKHSVQARKFIQPIRRGEYHSAGFKSVWQIQVSVFTAKNLLLHFIQKSIFQPRLLNYTIYISFLCHALFPFALRLHYLPFYYPFCLFPSLPPYNIITAQKIRQTAS